MVTPNSFKAALKRGDRQVGLWLSMTSSTAAEMGARAGFDWVLVDMEHSTNSEADTLGHLRATVGGTADALVRVPWNDAVIIKRMLDAGARSLLVPYVQSVEEAKRAVAATRYPPHGIRGYSGISRANDYARDKTYATNAHAEIFLAVQVESPEAAKLAGEIAAIDGIDGVFVGPNDLAANMGFVGQPAHPEVRKVVASVVAPVKAAGKAPGVLDFSVENAKGWFEKGFTWVAVGSDISLLNTGLNTLAAAFR